MIDDMNLRELQLESARALAVFGTSNGKLSSFNKIAHHNSIDWYKAVIAHYVEVYGDLPSKCPPGVNIKLLHEDV